MGVCIGRLVGGVDVAGDLIGRGIVHEEQRLLRNDRGTAHRVRHVRIGEVELRLELAELVAVDEAVDRPTVAVGLVGDVDGAAAPGPGELAGEEEPPYLIHNIPRTRSYQLLPRGL